MLDELGQVMVEVGQFTIQFMLIMVNFGQVIIDVIEFGQTMIEFR